MATSKTKHRMTLDEVVDALSIIEDATKFIDEVLDETNVARGNGDYIVRTRLKWTHETRMKVSEQRTIVHALIGEMESGKHKGLFDRLLKAKCSG